MKRYCQAAHRRLKLDKGSRRIIKIVSKKAIMSDKALVETGTKLWCTDSKVINVILGKMLRYIDSNKGKYRNQK